MNTNKLRRDRILRHEVAEHILHEVKDFDKCLSIADDILRYLALEDRHYLDLVLSAYQYRKDN